VEADLFRPVDQDDSDRTAELREVELPTLILPVRGASNYRLSADSMKHLELRYDAYYDASFTDQASCGRVEPIARYVTCANDDLQHRAAASRHDGVSRTFQNGGERIFEVIPVLLLMKKPRVPACGVPMH
jgi:hypothetical protein